jgi:hypothetical protein
MKGPLGADSLFYFSSLSFVVSFLLYNAVGYIWPIPMEVMVAYANPTGDMLGMASWVLAIAGVVMFVLGFIARRQ